MTYRSASIAANIRQGEESASADLTAQESCSRLLLVVRRGLNRPVNLAMIRKAAQMTQVEVARKLGVGQGVVSRLEHRDDMLLSTLYDYLMATGAEGAGIVVIVHGHRI